MDQAGQRYNLDTVVVWPWLCPHISGPLAQELTQTRSQLDVFVRLSVTLLVATVAASAMLLTDGPWLAIPVITALVARALFRAVVRTAVKMALRHQAWGAASQSCGLVSLPPDAAVQQQAQPVVGEVAEAMPHTLDLLDE
jgi:hypothetical protein